MIDNHEFVRPTEGGSPYTFVQSATEGIFPSPY